MTKLLPPKGFIVGAPKCGTTALAQYLSENPYVSFSRPKEPHFFGRDLGGLAATKDLDAYHDFFVTSEQTRICMEASIWSLYSKSAVKEMFDAQSEARMIIMLRNPVDVVPSLHRQLINAFDEDITDLGKAWDLSDDREVGKEVPAKCRAPNTLVYKKTAAFGEMLERFWSIVPRDQSLVIFQEEMVRDTRSTYQRALDFLGLPDDNRTVFPKVNAASKHHSRSLAYFIARHGKTRELVSAPLKKLTGRNSFGLTKFLKRKNQAKPKATSVDPDLLEQIARHYAPDVDKLIELLGDDTPRRLGWPTSATV